MDFARGRGVAMAFNAKPTGIALLIRILRDRHFEASRPAAGLEIGAAGYDRANEVGLTGATFWSVIAQGAGIAQSQSSDESSRPGQGRGKEGYERAGHT
jgi:hypothetical protein